MAFPFLILPIPTRCLRRFVRLLRCLWREGATVSGALYTGNICKDLDPDLTKEREPHSVPRVPSTITCSSKTSRFMSSRLQTHGFHDQLHARLFGEICKSLVRVIRKGWEQLRTRLKLIEKSNVLLLRRIGLLGSWTAGPSPGEPRAGEES
eukprot:gene19146-biopygen23465